MSAHCLQSGQDGLIHSVLLEIYADIRNYLVDDATVHVGLFVSVLFLRQIVSVLKAT